MPQFSPTSPPLPWTEPPCIDVSLTVHTRDGRRLEVIVTGPGEGRAFVFHSGTPSAAVPYKPLIDAVLERGLQFVTYSRPGYAGSTEHHGRSVADAASDVATILNELDVPSFVTLGRSGGGPHALACAAMLPDRCEKAATLAGVAPYPAAGLDWFAGMGTDNIEEFTLALEGEALLVPWLEQQAQTLASIRPPEVSAALGDLVSSVDDAALTGTLAEYAAESFRRSVSTGIAGWRDDDLAFARPWGFMLETISVPVSVWQGDQDRMVPLAHGAWLAAHIRGAEPHLIKGEGHLSLGESGLDSVLDDLCGVRRS